VLSPLDVINYITEPAATQITGRHCTIALYLLFVLLYFTLLLFALLVINCFSFSVILASRLRIYDVSKSESEGLDLYKCVASTGVVWQGGRPSCCGRLGYYPKENFYNLHANL